MTEAKGVPWSLLPRALPPQEFWPRGASCPPQPWRSPGMENTSIQRSLLTRGYETESCTTGTGAPISFDTCKRSTGLVNGFGVWVHDPTFLYCESSSPTGQRLDSDTASSKQRRKTKPSTVHIPSDSDKGWSPDENRRGRLPLGANSSSGAETSTAPGFQVQDQSSQVRYESLEGSVRSGLARLSALQFEMQALSTRTDLLKTSCADWTTCLVPRPRPVRPSGGPPCKEELRVRGALTPRRAQKKYCAFMAFQH